MALTMDVAATFAALNVLVLLGLAYLYGRMVWRSKAVFSIGLLVFSLLLLIQNSVTLYSYVAMETMFGEPVLPFLMAISALEFGGVVALARITL